MKQYFPEYYRSFSCIAGACPDSCCKEWTVDVDDTSAAYYRSLDGALGDRLRAVLQDTKDGTVMEIEDGRCPMWRQDGLCRIHAELGHDALCKTCREFPRLRHDYGDFVELGLELSCPEAARLILASEGNMLCEDVAGGEEPEYDAEVMQILKASRQQVLAVLESYPLPQALAIILLHAHDVQAQIDGEEAVDFLPDALLGETKKYVGTADVAGIFRFFAGLELLTEDWAKMLANAPVQIRWSKPLMRYLIGRYWLQAVSDFDLICRVKFMVTACILVGSLEGDFARAAQLFSKEVENDPDNVEAVLDGAYRSPALTDVNLFSILLGENAIFP